MEENHGCFIGVPQRIISKIQGISLTILAPNYPYLRFIDRVYIILVMKNVAVKRNGPVSAQWPLSFEM